MKQIYIEESLKTYIIALVEKTRNHPEIYLGASPRASIALLKASQAWAFFQKRDFVIPEDIKKMILPVLRHRLLIRQEAKLNKRTSEDIISSIIDKINIPIV